MQSTDHALALTKAGLAAIPVVGGPLSSLVGDYIPTAWQKSIDRFCAEIEDRVKALDVRLAPSKTDPDELADLLQQAIFTALRTSRDEKIRATANIITNAVLDPDDGSKLTYTELDHFLKAVDGLSSGALHVLGIAYTIQPSQRIEALLNRGNPGEIQFNSGDLYRKVLDIEPGLVMSLVAELDNWNLLRRGQVTVQSIENGVVTNIPIYLTATGIRTAASFRRRRAR